jgi:hypothetical protein
VRTETSTAPCPDYALETYSDAFKRAVLVENPRRLFPPRDSA